MKLLLRAAVLAVFVVGPACVDDETANDPPIAWGGEDTVVETSSSIVLLGSGSYDPDGAVQSFEWLLPGMESFVAVSAGDTCMRAPDKPVDSLTFVLRVTDDAGATATHTHYVSVARLDGTNYLPIIAATGPRVVPPDSTINLTASGRDPDGSIVGYEWVLEGKGDSAAADGDRVAVRAPRQPDMDYVCVLRALDDQGGVVTDTVRVIVSWLLSPNGGEVYHVGDSVSVEFAPLMEQIGLKLVIDGMNDSYLLEIPGVNETLVPISTPRVSFVIPDTIYEEPYGAVSTVSESCLIQAYHYLDPNTSVYSADFFSIRPAP
jgi:hypothetical protein